LSIFKHNSDNTVALFFHVFAWIFRLAAAADQFVSVFCACAFFFCCRSNFNYVLILPFFYTCDSRRSHFSPVCFAFALFLVANLYSILFSREFSGSSQKTSIFFRPAAAASQRKNPHVTVVAGERKVDLRLPQVGKSGKFTFLPATGIGCDLVARGSSGPFAPGLGPKVNPPVTLKPKLESLPILSSVEHLSEL